MATRGNDSNRIDEEVAMARTWDELARAANDRDLHSDIRRAARARLAAFDRLGELVQKRETRRALVADGRLQSVPDPHDIITATTRDTEAVQWLRLYRTSKTEPDERKLLEHLDRATVDLSARRETLELVLRLLDARRKAKRERKAQQEAKAAGLKARREKGS